MEPASGKIYGEMIETKRTETLCVMLGMTYQDVWKMRKLYNDQDVDNTNTITEAEFFYLINEDIRPLARAIFRITPELPPKPKRLNFDQMMLCLCTFASFTPRELLKFVFDVYANTFAGEAPGAFASKIIISSLGSQEIIEMGQELEKMQMGFRGTIDHGVQLVTDPDNFYLQKGFVSFQEFHQLSKKHYVLFYPIIRMQQHVRQGTSLGEKYWAKKVSEKTKVKVLVTYMERHMGTLPPLSLREKVIGNLYITSETNQLRERAKKIYKLSR